MLSSCDAPHIAGLGNLVGQASGGVPQSGGRDVVVGICDAHVGGGVDVHNGDLGRVMTGATKLCGELWGQLGVVGKWLARGGCGGRRLGWCVIGGHGAVCGDTVNGARYALLVVRMRRAGWRGCWELDYLFVSDVVFRRIGVVFFEQNHGHGRRQQTHRH